MKRDFKIVFCCFFCIFIVNAVKAQTPWQKKLNTESDGFQWYEYTYEKNSNGIYPKAAFDLNGRRLTPTTEHLVNYWKGFFEVWTRNDAVGHHVHAVYDKYGNCVIPDSFGFTGISIYPEYDLILCDDSMEIEGRYLFSMDGKYYTESPTGWGDKAEFNANKKPVSTFGRSSSYASNTSSYSDNFSSSSSSSVSGKPKLLYEGDYTQGKLIGQTTGWMLDPAFPHQHFTIYDTYLESQIGIATFEGKTSDGRRKYKLGGLSDETYFVDNNFNITSITYVSGFGMAESYSSTYTKGNVSYNVNTSIQNGYEAGGGAGTYNGGNTGGNTTTQSKRHQCGLCGGSGEVIDETSAVSFGNTKYCDKCRKTVKDSHYHTTCPSCKGKGWW